MTDILVTSPFRPFTLPTQFKAVFNGYIYCGTVDAVDPSVSQVQVYLVNESGDKVPVAQPLRTNAGGYLVYNGQPAKFVTNSNHSLLVRDSLGNQLWYAPNMAEIDPAAASFLAIEALRRSYAEAGYNLVAGSFEAGGTVTTATDVLLYEADGKAYSWGGTLPKTVPAGSTQSSSGGISASAWIDRGLSPNAFKQSGTGAVIRSAQDKMREMVSVADYGAVGDGVTNDTAPIQAAIDFAINNGRRGVFFPTGTYLIVPTLRPDGTRVGLIVNDGNTAAGSFDVPGIKLEGESNVWLKTTDAVNVHTILRWKASNSGMAKINFIGVRTKTIALEMSRIRQDAAGVFAHSDESIYNEFHDIWFKNVIRGITIEGSCYYNNFHAIHGFAVDQLLWLKLPDLFTSSGIGYQSTVNRNNFYGLTSLAGINGIKISCGDTNKFFGCAFEGLSGTAVEVFEPNDTYPTAGIEFTDYNTFYGTSNEANAQNLNYQGRALMNSFIDFESNLAKTFLANNPAIYIQSGSQQFHQYLKRMVTTDDADTPKHLKNRHYLEASTYANNFSDFIGTGSDGRLKGYDWRQFAFTAAQCTNVATIQWNNGSSNSYPIFKSIGGAIFYVLKMGFTVSNPTSNIVIPVPYSGLSGIFSFGNHIPMSFPITFSANSGAQQTAYAVFDGTTLSIAPPGGTWNATKNIIQFFLTYPRFDIITNGDTN